MSKLSFEFEGPEHENALKRLSARMAGTRYEDWPLNFHWNGLPGAQREDDFPVRRRRLLAVDGGEIRGHQNLFCHELWADGRCVPFSWVNGPFSEGIRDKNFAQVGVSLLRKGLSFESRQMMLGSLTLDAAPASLLMAMRWRQTEIPNFLLPLRLSKVLRNLPAVRLPKAVSLALHGVARVPGLSAAWRWYLRVRCARPMRGISLSVENAFGAWADDVWQEARNGYGALTRRDAATMNRVYAPDDAHFWRLRIRRWGRDIGWALLTMAQLDSGFGIGQCMLGTIVDAFAHPADAASVIASCTQFFQKAGADAIFASWSHGAWRHACANLGYHRRLSQYRLVVSPALIGALPGFPDGDRLHFSRGDCDGPWALTSAVPLPQCMPT